MKRLMLSLLVSVFCLGLFAADQTVELAELSQIALSNAKSLWGENLGQAEPIPYYDQDGVLNAWCFNFSLDKPFPEADILRDNCFLANAVGDRLAGCGGGEFGSMTLGAHRGMPVFIRYARMLSEDYSRGREVWEAAARELPGGYQAGKTYYLDQANIWFSFQGEGRTIYINPLPNIQVLSEGEFRSLAAGLGKFWEKRDHSGDWKDVPMSIGNQRTDVMISSVDYVPFYHWHWGCTPTAAAQLFSWWDQFARFGRLDHYYMTRLDPHQNDFEHHVTDTCIDLHFAMLTSDDGGTNSNNIDAGFAQVIQDRGYTTSSLYTTFSNVWDQTRQSIDYGFPLLTHTQSHSTTGVGYRLNPDMYCTVDPNHPVLTWVNLDELVFCTVMMLNQLPSYPQVSLTSPDGGQAYQENTGGETQLSNDYYEITWDTQESAGTYVKLYFDLAGGADPTSWVPISTNTPNDGSYVWQAPPVNLGGEDSTDQARIKIEMYDSNTNELLASDGSYGNFNIEPGGNPYLATSHYTISEEKDFCRASLDQASTWYLVSVKDNTSDDSTGWQIGLYSDLTFENQVEESLTPETNNYIAINNYAVPGQTYGIKFFNEAGQTSAYANYASSEGNQLVTGVNDLAWDSSAFGRIWKVFLQPGNNFFELSTTNSLADLDMALFAPGGDGIHTFQEAVAASRNPGPGGMESFSINVGAGGWYALVVTSRTAISTDFQVRIFPGIVWEGDLGIDWQTAGNWNTNSVPGSGDNVYVPGGCPNYPMVMNSITANAKSVTIGTGASLTIGTGTLVVNANLQTYGLVNLTTASSLLRVLGNASWESGSSFQTTVDSNLECYGNLAFQLGSTFLPSGGTVRMLSDRDTYISNHTLSSRFHKLAINKQDARTVYFLGSSTQDLKILNSLTFQSGYMGSSSDLAIILQGQMLDAGGGYRFDNGRFKLTGASGTIFGNTSSWFHDLEIASTVSAQLASDVLCKGSFILSSTGFNPNAHALETYDDIVIDGTLLMSDASSTLVSGDDFQWGSDASSTATAGTIECFGNWIVDTGAAVVLGNGVNTILSAYYGATITINSPIFQFGNLTINGTEENPRFYFDTEGVSSVTITGNLAVNATNTLDIMDRQVTLQGTLNLYGTLDVNSGQFTTNNAPNLYAGSILDIGAGTFWNAKTTASTAYLYGTLVMDDPAGVFGGTNQSLNVPAGSVNSLTAGTIRCGTMNASNANTFQPSGGLVEFTTFAGHSTPYLTVSNGNWLHDAKVNTSTAITLLANLIITGNLELFNGTLDVSTSNYSISIAGNWTHLQPGAVFVPRAGRVVFYGEEDQYLIGNETFNIVENANTGGAILLNNTAYTLTCAAYDTAVGYEQVQVTAGTFTANNLLDDGIFGNWAVQSHGVVNLSNPDGSVDLKCGVNLSGGTMNIFGGTADSRWSEDANTSITISSGLLNFADRSIIIGDSAILTENISGGTIRTVGNFTCNNAAFSPAGGYIELVGAVNTNLAMNSGHLWNLKVNKNTGNAVTATTALVLENDFLLINGSFAAGGNIEVAGDWFNQVNPDNFNEGAYSVNFNGTGLQQISWPETFYTMYVSNITDRVELGAVSLGIRNVLSVSGMLKLLPGSTVLVETNKSISVGTNGRLEALGTLQNPILFTKLGTGNWNLSVSGGGVIAAEYSTFEYTNPNSIRILSTGVVDPGYAFNYCTFQNASSGTVHLRLENSQDLIIQGACFPIDNGGYNVYKPNDGGSATFVNATGILAGEDHDYDNFNRINWTSGVPQITSLDIAYDGGNAVLTWTCSPAHDNFRVYAGDAPEGPFTLIGSSSVTTWSEPASNGLRFYRVTAWQAD
jgi:hypothetical protein